MSWSTIDSFSPFKQKGLRVEALFLIRFQENPHRIITDRERFELSIPGSPVCRFSRPVPSTTRPPVLGVTKVSRTMCVKQRDRSQHFGAFFLEETSQHPRTFISQDAALHLRTMIEPRVAQQISNRPCHPGFLVPRPKNYARNACEDDRSRAHCARLEGHVESAVVESPPIEVFASFADREQLGVSGSVLIANRAIVRR